MHPLKKAHEITATKQAVPSCTYQNGGMAELGLPARDSRFPLSRRIDDTVFDREHGERDAPLLDDSVVQCSHLRVFLWSPDDEIAFSTLDRNECLCQRRTVITIPPSGRLQQRRGAPHTPANLFTRTPLQIQYLVRFPFCSRA